MIAIFGNIAANDVALINQLKKFFEADDVILNWNGEDEYPASQTTLAITNIEPPYQTNCNVLSLDAAQRLLNS